MRLGKREIKETTKEERRAEMREGECGEKEKKKEREKKAERERERVRVVRLEHVQPSPRCAVSKCLPLFSLIRFSFFRRGCDLVLT